MRRWCWSVTSYSANCSQNRQVQLAENGEPPGLKSRPSPCPLSPPSVLVSILSRYCWISRGGIRWAHTESQLANSSRRKDHEPHSLQDDDGKWSLAARRPGDPTWPRWGPASRVEAGIGCTKACGGRAFWAGIEV